MSDELRSLLLLIPSERDRARALKLLGECDTRIDTDAAQDRPLIRLHSECGRFHREDEPCPSPAQPSREDEPNPEARERERLRKAAQGGVCEVCGRTAEQDAEPQIRSWQRAEAVTRAERDALRAERDRWQAIAREESNWHRAACSERDRLREALRRIRDRDWKPVTIPGIGEVAGPDYDVAREIARAALDAREEGTDA